jgi:crotonobetainyl-CoA:carnitine CoA-transferase CaiB-like acyl-CoA transferase
MTVQRTTDEWVAAMEAAGVPCGPINTLDRVFADPHVQARGTRIEMAHPLAKAVPLVANPIRLSESPVQYRQAPPTLGQHTEEVLVDWLEVSVADIDALRAKQAI